jgi:hypothetical protein
MMLIVWFRLCVYSEPTSPTSSASFGKFIEMLASDDPLPTRRIDESTETSTRECMRCHDAPARSPYLYCGPCTAAAHAVSRQASMRNHLNRPPIKVYRWNPDKKDWVLKGES